VCLARRTRSGQWRCRPAPGVVPVPARWGAAWWLPPSCVCGCVLVVPVLRTRETEGSIPHLCTGPVPRSCAHSLNGLWVVYHPSGGSDCLSLVPLVGGGGGPGGGSALQGASWSLRCRPLGAHRGSARRSDVCLTTRAVL